MPLNKKGSPEKIVTLTDAELNTLRTLVIKARKAGIEPSVIFPLKKDKK